MRCCLHSRARSWAFCGGTTTGFEYNKKIRVRPKSHMVRVRGHEQAHLADELVLREYRLTHHLREKAQDRWLLHQFNGFVGSNVPAT